MNRLNRKLRKGETLKRVRDIRERIAQQDVAQATAAVQRSADEAQQRRSDLTTFEAEADSAAAVGISMRSFMRFQGFREMHVAATEGAERRCHEADLHATSRREALQVATTDRRTADRLVSIISARRVVAQKRLDQKKTDDLTCARFALRGQAA